MLGAGSIRYQGFLIAIGRDLIPPTSWVPFPRATPTVMSSTKKRVVRVSVQLVKPIRVLVLTEQRLLAEMVKLTLDHGVYIARDAKDLGAATTIIDEWEPRLAVVDMDSGGDQLVRRIGQAKEAGSPRISGSRLDPPRRSEDQAGGLRSGRGRRHDRPHLTGRAPCSGSRHHAAEPRRECIPEAGVEAGRVGNRYPEPPGARRDPRSCT